jgi:hypothetical protein
MVAWRQLDSQTINQCVDEELRPAPGKDALKCGHERGAYKTFFEHEKISPGLFWAQTLGGFLVLDFLITALLIAAFYVVRWIVKGFRPEG